MTGNAIRYILYAENYNNERYYIINTDPVIWDPNILAAKTYYTSKQAEYDVIGYYYNYRSIKQLKDKGSIRKLYVAEVTEAGEELRRVDIL